MNHLEALVSLKAVGDGFKEDDLFLLFWRLNQSVSAGRDNFTAPEK